jgi:hypothetical protein
MKSSAEIFDDVAAVASSRSTTSLVELFNELEVAVLVDSELPPDVYEKLKALLRMESFLRLQESWRLVRFVDGNWELMGDSQRKELRPLLVQSFDKFGDWMGAFVTSEILGGRYADAAALKELTDISERAAMPARSLAAHGFGKLVEATKDERTRGAAVDRLRSLSVNDDDAIRKEALEELRRLDASK